MTSEKSRPWTLRASGALYQYRRLCKRKPVTAMKLYSFFRSSAAFRVRIALELKGVDWQTIPIHLRAGGQHRAEFLAVNPQGLVPVLDDDGVVLGQSLAIIEYLEERYPSPALLPSNAADRARVRAMAQSIACDIHPLNNQRVLKYLRAEYGQDEAGVNRWIMHWIGEGFRPLEQLAKRYSGDGLHCFGAQLSMADVLLVPQMYNARRFNCDLQPFPTLVAISAHLEQLPAFMAARPEAQPDAE